MGGVAWTEEEDYLLKKCIERYGEGKWHRIPVLAGLKRCRKSCRLRWLNYLRPNIKRGSFAAEEVNLIINLHSLLGNRWSLIAGRLPGRTANDVKNYWNCHLSKKLTYAPQSEDDQTAAATTTASMKPRSPAHVSPNTQQETSVWAPFHDVQVNQQGQEVAAEEPGTLLGDLEFDEGGSSKWDWDDFIFNMDLWTASL
ncbi:hypothetical protein ERO13_A13G102300v2 [Gossypium hirsutum]|uniref:Transcription factor MYB114 isoform X1 n=4 Tax=Gossypium TaxID=3633 RepID=A0A1U8IEZ4_GOSHI|nr:transcription factor MYB114 isoform X1 [Gossypium hirsutum]KAB2048495.1 hypothetical protein ES319_A13G117200v1 [Gossypium barbadense]KAG4165943.1 hypothetical protein ERO13_A13G102300v2 [Gossypium hirsutum]TYH91578.1 hypothetical protein ES332_A13G125300v1 [Gossypium tomentosum]TYJ00942.1 hypothetical protein E1A91_A13G120200v1 [Gossypium mustelinum]